MSKDNDPIVGDAEPSGVAAWWANLRSAVEAMRARARANPQPIPRARVKAQRARAASPDGQAGPTKAEVEAEREVHGAPAFWMAPFFLAFAAVFGLPLAANTFAAAAPRDLIGKVAAALPEPVAPLGAMMAGWLWAPWWVALPALLMRLRGAWMTGRGVLDAVGWGMAAWAIEGAAWLYFGRESLKTGFSPAEQTGCWRLLVAEFVFLLVTATMFGPPSPRRPWFQSAAK